MAICFTPGLFTVPNDTSDAKARVATPGGPKGGCKAGENFSSKIDIVEFLILQADQVLLLVQCFATRWGY